MDRCLEEASQFLEDPRQDSTKLAIDVMGGNYCRLFIWIGIVRFLGLLVLSQPHQGDSRLREFTIWRLVMGLLELLDEEYSRQLMLFRFNLIS